MDSLTVSLVMVVRDEANCIARAIASVRPYVDEAIVFDTGSVDQTPTIADALGCHVIRLDTVFTQFDFGEAKTAVSWMARGAYVLLLDADESLSGAERLLDVVEMMDERNVEAVAFPRRRWLDEAMTIQIEKEAYPDWQVRLYRNGRRRWHGVLHETLGGVNAFHLPVEQGIQIEHFVDPYHLADPRRAERRLVQRRLLARTANVLVEGSAEAARRAGL